MQRFFAIGNLTRDPEMRYTPDGKAVVQFSIAVNEGRGEKRTTEFFNCVAWDKLAEVVAEYARKGRKVHIEGKLRTETWTDKTSGQKRYATKVTCSNVEFLDRGDETPKEGDAAQTLEDLPF